MPNQLNQLMNRPQINGAGLKILNDKPEDKDKKIVAVIVSLCSGGSYDQLFTTVEQKAMEGTKVEVYSCNSIYISKF